MPTTIFPTWPHILFAVIEPLTLIGGWLCPVLDLQRFITDQIPTASTSTKAEDVHIHPTSFALAYQLANLYGLLAILGTGVMHATSEPKVLLNYLIALAVADVGHIYVTYLAIGWDVFFDVKGWNILTWGNIGVTGFLFVNRLLYFAGAFGYAQSGADEEESKKRV
ncbi:hypothetical protein BJX68DRAFT_81499 [Aspergillus pseudodeflectus]|uniref:DUF7704 domain-containing protein n=1 Tax=Aspergillus pseudodeflectus TaxID=176178 RepID=A0ABR4L6V5_9EURO